MLTVKLQASNYESNLLIITDQNVYNYINQSMLNYKNLERFICLANIESLPCGFLKGHIKINDIYIPLLSYVSDYMCMGSSINKIICGNNMISFGNYSFYWCNNLTYIELPNNLTSIGRNCFANSNLSNIKFNSKLKTIEKYSFENCKIKKLYLPSNIQYLANGAFHRCYELEYVIIDSNIEVIPHFLFSRCINLKQVIIRNKNVKEIQTDAFEDCPNLQQVIVYNKMINVCDGAFSKNNNILKYVNI